MEYIVLCCYVIASDVYRHFCCTHNSNLVLRALRISWLFISLREIMLWTINLSSRFALNSQQFFFEYENVDYNLHAVCLSVLGIVLSKWTHTGILIVLSRFVAIVGSKSQGSVSFKETSVFYAVMVWCSVDFQNHKNNAVLR